MNASQDAASTSAKDQPKPSTVSESVAVALDKLFLDPNNYRFIDADDYEEVPDANFLDAQIQKRTNRFILGEKQENVRDLIDSFYKNGWLPVDQIQAKRLPNGIFLVVEGNRRVATLKFLAARYRDSAVSLGNLDPSIFESVPVVIYPDADESHHLILMGLKHISGNKKWPTINQAELLRTLSVKHGMSPKDIGMALGISRREYNLSNRALTIVRMYKDSEYGDQFRSDQYNVCREIVNSPALRDWIQWDEDNGTVRNTKNLNRIFSLMSNEVGNDGDHGDEEQLGPGTSVREPAITTGAQMREFAKILSDPDAVSTLESTRSLSQAIMGAGVLAQNQIKRAVDTVEDSTAVLFGQLARVRDSDIEKVAELGKKLLTLGAMKNKKTVIAVGDEDLERELINLTTKEGFEHFSTIKITDYKAHKELTLSNLARVNILVGPNNAGKTSVLEAIYLLTQQSEVRGLFEIVTRRGKLGNQALPKLLFQLIPPSVQIEGTFDHQLARVNILQDKDNDSVSDKTGYIGSILVNSNYSNYLQSSETHLFDKRDPQRSYSKNPRILCRSLLSSPFSMHDPRVLVRVHEKAVEKGGKERVLAFLRGWVDRGLKNIELLNEFQRFFVLHDDPSKNLDLTHFGEGMQRIFMIALVFAYAENGIVLIDELENALHTSLLHEFTRFLRELAIAFNAQVFVTSHSKECIDAFVQNQFPPSDVSAYVLVQRNDRTECIHRSGEQLAELLEFSDVDIRRAR